MGNQNTLMFEVGVSNAVKGLDQLEQQLSKAVASMQDKMKLQIEVKNLETFVNALKSIGDGKQLQPLLDRIEALQTSLVRLGLVPQNLDYSKLEKSLQNITAAYDNFQKAVKKSGDETKGGAPAALEALRIARGRLEKEFGMTEQVARATFETFQKSGATAAAAIEKLGSGASASNAGLQSLETRINSVNSAIETLARQMGVFLSEMKQMNTSSADAGRMKSEAQDAHAVIDALKQKNQVVEQGTQATQQQSEATKQLAQDIENLKRKLNFGKQDKLTYQEEIRDAAAELKKIGLSWRDIGDSSKMAAGTEQAYLAILKEEEAMTQRIAETRRQMGREATLSQLGGTKADREFYMANRGFYDTSGNVWDRISELESLKRKRIGSYIEDYDAEMDAKLKKDIENKLRFLQQHIREAIMRMLRMGGNIDNIEAYGRSGQSNFGESLDNRIEKIRDKIDEKISKMIDDYDKRIQQKFSKGAYYTYGEKEERDAMKMGVGLNASYYADVMKERKSWVQETNEEIKVLQQQIAEKEKLIQANNQSAAAAVQAAQSSASANTANTETLKSEGTAANVTKEQMEALIAAKKAVTDAEQQQSKVNTTNAETLKKEGDAANKAKQDMDQLANAGNKGGQDNLFNPQKFATLQEAIDKVIAEVNRLATALSGMKFENLAELTRVINSLQIDASGLASVFKTLDTGIKFDKSAEEVAAYEKKIAGLKEQVTQLENNMKTLTEAAKKANKEVDNSSNGNGTRATELTNLDSIRARINDVTKALELMRAEQAKMNADGYSNLGLGQKIRQLEEYKKHLESLLKMDLTKANALKSDSVLFGNQLPLGKVSTQQIREAIAEVKTLIAENKKATQTVSKLSSEEQRLAQSVRSASDQMRGQSQVLSDLKMMATQYLSVWGAQSFIHSIIETGGLLEQQRLSIGAILGDIEQANTLFGQIKDLAIKSPFGVVQLDTMTKQLTAYGFQYKELFDWTKRLADISAATGTEVSRLSLALGHVRAEGALSGYTLRQFAMANVPVLRMLSENLGITTKEVRDKVRKKEISYDDVKDIFMQLTNEGGMFYNAQEVMSQALNAKFKNLRDAFDIMYGEIAEGGVGDALKKVAESLTAMAKHWERVATDILGVAAAFGAMKAVTLLSTSAIGANTIASLDNIKATLQREKANMRLAYAAGYATKADYEKTMAQGAYTVSALKVALVEKKLSIDELQRAVALGRVNKQVALAAATQAGYNAQLITGVTVLRGWQKGLFLFAEGINKAKLAVKSFFTTMWPLLALTAVFDLFSRVGDQNDKASEAATSAAKATNKYSELQAMAERMGASQGKSNDTLSAGIKEMKEALTAVGAYTEELKKNVDAVQSLADKYDVLRDAMRKVSDEAKDKTSRQQALISEGLKTGSNAWGGGWNPFNWFRDNALKDAKDIDDYTEKLYLALDKYDKVMKAFMKRDLSHYIVWDKKYDTASAKDIFMSLSSDKREILLNHLRDSSSKDERKAGHDVAYALWGDSVGDMGNYSGYSYMGAINELRGHRDAVAKAFASAFRVAYPEIDLEKATEEQKVVFDKWLKKTIEGIEGLKEAGQRALRNIIIEGTIRVVPKYKLDNEAFNDFITEMKEQYPLAYEQWQRHGDSSEVLTEDARRKSAESYKRTLGNTSVRTIGNESKKRLKELNEERKRLVAFQSSIVYKDSKEQQEENKAAIAKIDEETKRLKQAQKDYNQYGDPDKNKGEDKNAKKLRERVRILKEAEQAYQYWRKLVGDEGAVAHVNSEFGKLLSEQNFSFDNVKQFRETLANLRKEYETKPKSKSMLEALKELDKIFADLDRKDFEKNTEEFLSKTRIELDNLTRSWDMFNTVREQTGDVALATGITGVGGSTRNLADDLKKKIWQDFSNAGGADIDFNADLSDKEIEQAFFSEMPAASQEKIKALVEEYKKWRDLQRDVIKNDVTTFAQLLGSAQDYDTVLKKIDDNLKRQLVAIDNLKKPDNVDEDTWNSWKERAKAIAKAKAEADKFKLSNDYVNVMNHSLSMTMDAIKTSAELVEKNLNKQLKEGVLNAQQYAEEMDKVHKILRDKRLNSFFGASGAWGSAATGGINGAVSWFDDAISKRRKELSKAGVTDLEEQNKDSELSKLLNSRGKWEGVQAAMSDLTLAISIVVGVLDGMTQATKSLSEMFDALGNESAANAWGDVSDTIKGVSGIFSPIDNIMKNAMSGNVSGLVSSVISGPIQMVTGPITAFAQLHDKKMQRQIEAIQHEIEALEANTAAIKSARERTLGYDYGNVRRAKVAMANSQVEAAREDTMTHLHYLPAILQDAHKAIAANAMSAYYSQNSQGTGYQQELKNIREERQKYVDLYSAENGKKKKSESALEEYKAKIAELDDKITYFVEDTLKELWGIDLKGWADQIGDALMNAFENGENAVKAFRDTVKQIMSQVVSEMIKLGIIEPLMEDMRKELFGYTDSNGNVIGGVFNQETGMFDEQKTLSILGKYLGEGGSMERAISAAENFYNMAERVSGISLSSKENTSLSSSIKGTTEQTADLIASYLNAIRADVSVNRAMIAQYFPMFYSVITSGNQSIRNIELNTAAIMRSNDVIASRITEMQDDVHGLKLGTWKVPTK